MIGFVCVDKPTGPTSHDVVDAVRRAFGTRRVGHAGTLDPPATGLLVCGVDKATRLLRFLSGLPKTYEATGVLGVETDTLDATGEVVAERPVGAEAGELREVLEAFRGEIDQVPPQVSAVKVAGERAYEKAARGEEVEIEPRRVVVHGLELTGADGPRFSLRVTCSTGTYVRSLVRDVGRRLGCGAHVETLRRTRIGHLDVADAVVPDELGPEALLPVERGLAHLKRVEVDAEAARRAGHGQRLETTDGATGEVLLVGPDGAVGIFEAEGGMLRPVVVLAASGGS